MSYAPIVIPTLNRIDHLKRCINSLKKNTLASKTDLYIAVDYPPSEKYVAGYNQICEYLKRNIDGFNKVQIIYRKNNFGSIKNIFSLCDEVLENYDSIIVLEDDNELSPNFLHFCNIGLEQYESDESILAINASSYVWCGKGMELEKFNDHDSIHKRQLIFHSYAIWKNRYIKLKNWCQSYAIVEDGFNLKKMYSLRKSSRCFFFSFIDNVLYSTKQLPWIGHNIYQIDQVMDYYMLIYKMYVVYPKTSLVRDWGCDGTGDHYTQKFENMSQILNVKIDENLYFKLDVKGEVNISKYEILMHNKYNYRALKDFIKMISKIVFCLLHKKRILKQIERWRNLNE